MGRHEPGGTARRAALALVLVVVFLTFGLPRWLAGDPPPVGAHAGARFAKVCRAHGGTPSTGAQRSCTVRYGRRVYVMDAITPDGFDEDTARFQRQGCREARREQASTAPAGRRRSFVYHPRTGVCERRS